MEWVLGAALAVLAILLLGPLRLFAGMACEGRPRWRAEVVALGGLLRLGRDDGCNYWACGRFRRALAPPSAGRAGVTPSATRRGRALVLKWGRLNGGERRAFLRMLGSVWSAMEITVRGNIRYGFEDAAVTAWIHALHCMARSAGRMATLEAEADFSSAGWSGHAEAVVTVRPIGVMVPAARFFIRLFIGRIMNKCAGGKRRWLVQT